ncbi:pyridoxal phosphate-dependent transferase [Hypoxylon sp. NC1633]|nr:pyridoxal phosphate-dependent transferase [Hypoxylon sp. NC1633]
MIPTLEKGLWDAKVSVNAMLVTNPHNPLGRCYSKENLIEIMQFCQRHNLHLISDEVFALSEHGCDDLPKPRKFTSAMAIDAVAHGCDPSKVHVIWSMSKDLGATGARLGCVVTRNKDVRDSIAVVTHIGVSKLSQTRDDEKVAVAFYQNAGILFFSAAKYHMPPDFKGWMRISLAVEPEKLDVALDRLKVAYQTQMVRGLSTSTAMF